MSKMTVGPLSVEFRAAFATQLIYIWATSIIQEYLELGNASHLARCTCHKFEQIKAAKGKVLGNSSLLGQPYFKTKNQAVHAFSAYNQSSRFCLRPSQAVNNVLLRRMHVGCRYSTRAPGHTGSSASN